MKKSLFYSVAIAAAMASCTQEAIEVPSNNVQDLSIRPVLGEVVLVEDAGIASRFAAGNGAQPVFSEGDKLGAAIMDAPKYPEIPYNEENPAANYSIVNYYSSNSAFTYDGSAWYLNEDQPLVEGNYMFYAPYNAAMQFRTPFKVAVPAKQAASTEKAALDEFYASGSVVRVGYQFLAAEGGVAQKPKVTMNDVFAYPMFTIKNNFEGYLQSLVDEDGNVTVSSYKGALKVDSIKLINGSDVAIVVGGVLSNQSAATTMAEEWSVSPMANFTAQLLSENNQVEVAAGEVITTLVAGGREIAQGESAKFYAVMPAVKFEADDLQAKVYVTINNKPYVISTSTNISWSEVAEDSDEEAVPVIGGTIEKSVSYATTTGPVTLIKGQRYPQEEVNFINGSLSAKSIAGKALTLDLTGGLLDSEDADDELGTEEAVLFAQEIAIDGDNEDEGDEGEETDYIDNNTEFIAFIADRENGTNYVENTDDFIFAENTTAEINSEMIDALFAYNNRGSIKIEKSLVIANDVEVVAIDDKKVTFESTNGKQYTIEFGADNYSTANNIVSSTKSVHVLKEGTYNVSSATTLNNLKNRGIMHVNSHLSVTTLVNDSVLNVTHKITKGFENNGTVNVNSTTAYIIVNAGVGEIVASPANAAATVTVTGGTQTGICTLTGMGDIDASTDNAVKKTWINEWKLTDNEVVFQQNNITAIPNRAITFHIASNNVKFTHTAAATWSMKNMTLCLEGTSDMTITGDHVELTTVKNVTIKNETNYQVTLNNIAMGDAETASATYVGLEGGLVADGYNATWNGAAIGVNAEEALRAAIAEGGEVKLVANLNLTTPLIFNAGNEVTLDLNGKTIQAPVDNDAIVVNDGKLTITGNGIVKASNGNKQLAVWADGTTAEVVIENGTFIGSKDSNNKTNDVIYVKNGGKITINGGSFSNENEYDSNGGGVVINAHNESQGLITVNAGTFNAATANGVYEAQDVTIGKIVWAGTKTESADNKTVTVQ